MNFDHEAALQWCYALAQRHPKQTLTRDGEPYLDRYFLAGWNPLVPGGGTPHAASIFLHHFLRNDNPDQVHSHPWEWSSSLILVGGYREERCDQAGRRTAHIYLPGDVNTLAADTRHRIDLIDGECWTLFLVGCVRQAWSFFPVCP